MNSGTKEVAVQNNDARTQHMVQYAGIYGSLTEMNDQYMYKAMLKSRQDFYAHVSKKLFAHYEAYLDLANAIVDALMDGEEAIFSAMDMFINQYIITVENDRVMFDAWNSDYSAVIEFDGDEANMDFIGLLDRMIEVNEEYDYIGRFERLIRMPL